MTHRQPARTTTRRVPRILVAGLLVVAAIGAAFGYQLLPVLSSTAASPIDVLRGQHRGVRGGVLPGTVWPAYGQAAVQIGQAQIQAGPNQHVAAIASVAKVMTAYVVLRDHPLALGQDGPTITLTDADVADTDRRRRQQESVVPIVAGEQLTERQALLALLLPSANNIAAVLARWDAGSVERFLVRMNTAARSLGMTHTRYTDPSGYDAATVSTAADQVRIVDRAMSLPVFASIVATPSATLPVAGTVNTTNTLLGHNGFVGVKTGSDEAAGGCFAFRAIRWIDGKRTAITGVVLSQPGDDQVEAGLAAADAMVHRIAGDRATPGLGQPALPPPIAPGSHGSRLPVHVRRHWRGTGMQQSPARSGIAPASTQSVHGREDMSRTVWPLAALATLAVIVTGCGNGTAGTSNSTVTSGGNGATSIHEKAVKFAECMRANGVSAFPDPDASGSLTIDGVVNGSSLDPNSATFKQAIGACKNLEPPGFTGTRATPQQRTARLKFAQCMRDNGVPDFPDPTPNGPLIDTNRIPSLAGKDPRTDPGLNAAMHRCRGFAAAAGVRP